MKRFSTQLIGLAIAFSLSPLAISLLGLLPEKSAIANSNVHVTVLQPKKSIKEIPDKLEQLDQLRLAINRLGEDSIYERAKLIKESADIWFEIGSSEYIIYKYELNDSPLKYIEAYERSLDFYQRASDLYSSLELYTEKADSLLSANHARFKLRQYRDIQASLRQEIEYLARYEKHKEKKIFIDLLNGYSGYWLLHAAMGFAGDNDLMYRMQNQDISWQEILEISQLNLFVFDETKRYRDSLGYSEILRGIGWSYRNLGNYSQALYYLEHAVEIQEDRGRIEPYTLIDIATVYTDIGQYDKALEILEIADSIASPGYEVLIMSRIGVTYKEMGQYDKALSYLENVLSMRSSRRSGYRPIYLNYIAEIHFELGEYKEALGYYEMSVDMPIVAGEQDISGFIYLNQGKAYAQLDNSDEALEAYKRALSIFRFLNNRAGESQTLSNIAFLLEDLDQPELAIAFHKEAVNITESIRSNVSYLPIETQQSYLEKVSYTYRRLADLLLQENRILEAQRVLDLLKVHELDGYLRGVQRNAQTESGIILRPQEQEVLERFDAAQSQLVELGRELLELEAIELSDRTPEQKERIDELRQLQMDARSVFQTFLESDEIKAVVAELRQTTGSTNPELPELNALQDNLRRLEQNAVVLYPLILEDRLELIIVTANSPPLRRTVSVSREDLNRGIAEMRSALQSPSSDAVTPAQQLYDWLIRPIEADLEQANADTIIYAPDSQLRYIPLSALHDGNQWLTERFRVNNITAASIDDLDNQPTPELEILAAAFSEGQYTVPIRDRTLSFGGLEYAGREVENLSQLIPQTEKRLNEAFDSGIVLDMNDFSVVHLATHATFNPGPPEDSFILFGDGSKATLTDIKSWNFPNVDLVVLSACETAVGDVPLGNGEEILGFGYLMQLAGADAAIASLWAVSDGGTQVLMNAFYGALQDGNSKAEALRQAQIALIERDFAGLEIRDRRDDGTVVAVNVETGLPPAVSNNLSHPYYWAPFILIGNGL